MLQRDAQAQTPVEPLPKEEVEGVCLPPEEEAELDEWMDWMSEQVAQEEAALQGWMDEVSAAVARIPPEKVAEIFRSLAFPHPSPSETP